MGFTQTQRCNVAQAKCHSIIEPWGSFTLQAFWKSGRGPGSRAKRFLDIGSITHVAIRDQAEPGCFRNADDCVLAALRLDVSRRGEAPLFAHRQRPPAF